MAKFTVEGREYDSEEFSPKQKSLVSWLALTKSLIQELKVKADLFQVAQRERDKSLKKELGSKVKEFIEGVPSPGVKLANGHKISYSEMEHHTIIELENLNFLSSELSYYNAQLQVLDTARIEYSKQFYETIKSHD